MNGGTQLGVYETFEDIFGRKSTWEELIAEIRAFKQQSVLWVCATIAAGMQLWTRLDLQPEEVYRQLLRLFFGPELQARLLVGFWSTDPRRVLFHRRQILLIAKLAILHCSGEGIDARANAKRFGSVLLKANDQFHYGLMAELASQSRAITGREDYAKIIAEMIAASEHGSPTIAHLIARNHLMLTRFTQGLRDDPDFVDVADAHERATGLALEEFEALIFGVHSRFGGAFVKAVFTNPGVLPLKDENFATTAVPPKKARSFVDSLAGSTGIMRQELGKSDNGANDFTIFRKFPLIQQYYNLHLRTAWCGFLMMDNLFFLEKVQSGPYWNANAIHGVKLHRFWGSVFEQYVNALMQNACAETTSIFVPDPRSVKDPNVQLCDGMVISGDSLVLMEYKSSMFRADTKYSGNPAALTEEIEKKLVEDRQAKQRKGVLQLAEAVKNLFGSTRTRVTVAGLDSSKVKRVFLYIVTLDSVGSTVGISPFLNTFLDEHLDRNLFPRLEIRPLFCSDIETLEEVTGYFPAAPLSEILERWFETNPSLATPLLAIDFRALHWRANQWLRDEWHVIYKNIVRVLFPDKDPNVALAQAIRMGNK